MKQSTGRLFNARLLSRNTAVGIVAASAAALVVAACGGGSHDPCPNLPQPTAVIGQPTFKVGTPNSAGGVTGANVGGVQGASAASSDTLYVADTSNNRILGFSPIPAAGSLGATASFVIGQTSLDESSGGIGTQAAIKFSNPSRVWIDPTNTYLVVADSSNNRVLIWNSLPKSATDAPSVVIGQPDFTSRDANHPNATVSATSLSNPTSAIIANGFLVVVDKGNNRVLIWNTVPTTSGAAANIVLGQVDKVHNAPNIDQYNNSTQTYTLFMRQPSDAWTDGSNLIISDTGNHRVLSWNGIPGTDDLIAANVVGQSQFGVTSLSGGSGTTGLHSPWGVTSDGASLFVADTANNRVLEYTNFLTVPQSGPAATEVFGQQDFTHITQNDPDQDNKVGDQRNNPATLGPTQGTLFNPQGLAMIGTAQLVVTDSGNSRVLLYPANSGVDGSDTDLCN